MSGKRYIITGGPSSGKSTLIKALRNEGFFCREEVAREVITEQLEKGGQALPWLNNAAFSEIVFQRMKEQYAEPATGVEFYDRSIPDVLAYFKFWNNETPSNYGDFYASVGFETKVFFLPFWEEIYHNDAERKESDEEAIRIGEFIRKEYENFGHEVIEIPKGNIEDRVRFVTQSILIKN